MFFGEDFDIGVLRGREGMSRVYGAGLTIVIRLRNTVMPTVRDQGTRSEK